MRKLVSMTALLAFMLSLNVNAQEKPKEKAKKECAMTDKKACSTVKKGSCCAAKKAATKA